MKKNILLSLRNITRHLTEKNKIILFSLRNILRSSVSMLLASALFTSAIFASALILPCFLIVSPTSALEYQDNVNMQFTFTPTLSVSLSGDLALPNLQPGASADSNTVSVNVSTNNITGYTLTASVGNESYTHGGTNYNANDLVFTNGAPTPEPSTVNKFTSLSITDSYPSLNDESVMNNSWGYSYLVNDGATWSNYSGLPIYTDPSKNINIATTATEDDIKFKIGAKAATTQIAGEYTNIVNFVAITNAAPISISDAFELAGKTRTPSGYYKMQDMSASICNTADIDTNAQLIDVRDNEVYTVAKLKDGRCWMLDNLRLNPTDSGVAAILSEDNTNAPNNAIYNYLHGGNPEGVEGWSNTAVIDATSGFATYTELIVNTAHNNDSVINYGSGNGKIGIYYNYCAASIGIFCYDKNSGKDLPGTLVDVIHDVCPSNWRLPTSGNDGEFAKLYTYYRSGDATNTDSFQYNLSLAMSGNITDNRQLGVDGFGFYWSSTYYGEFENSTRIYNLSVTPMNVYPSIGGNHRFAGFSIRCVVK